MSYFIDRTVITSQTLQDWPDRSVGEVDCFLSNSFLYISPIEQVPTDRLNNCTVFFEQCQSNCSADDFQSCAQECATCLTQCTNALRSDLEVVRVCDPPPVNDDGSSCTVSNSSLYLCCYWCCYLIAIPHHAQQHKELKAQESLASK